MVRFSGCWNPSTVYVRTPWELRDRTPGGGEHDRILSDTNRRHHRTGASVSSVDNDVRILIVLLSRAWHEDRAGGSWS